MDTAYIEQLLQQNKQLIEQNKMLVNGITRIANKMEADDSEWVNAQQAMKLLGFKVSTGSKRKLANLRKLGFLTKFASTHPYIYNRNEVTKTRDEIIKRGLIIPSR